MHSDAPILYVISGAGLSAESGISTFRDKDGLWAQFDLERVCNFDNWQANRDEVFDFYERRHSELYTVEPNEAHRALAQWQARWGVGRVRLLTQNVDALLEAAGASRVTHLHGDLRDLRCVECERTFRVLSADYGRNCACPSCGKVESVKPGVVFFREMAPAYSVVEEMRDALRPQDIVLVVGTSLEVLTVYQLLPHRRKGHERNWQVNPEPTEQAWFEINHSAPASTGLKDLEPQLIALMDETEELGVGLDAVVAPGPLFASHKSATGLERLANWLGSKLAG